MAEFDPGASGSTPLNNVRHEAFCQLYAGKCWGNGAKAYKSIYCEKGKPQALRQLAHQLLTKVDVWQRIEFLRDENLRIIGMDRQEAVQILGEIARGRLQDYVSKDGAVSIHAKPNERAVQEITVTEEFGGEAPRRLTKIKLRDPVAAIERIAKITGLDKPKHIDVTSGGKPIARTEVVLVPAGKPGQD
jgi:hypothetical protein